MATTVTAAPLTVTLKESVTLNGVDYGGTNTLTIGSVNEVSKRIVTATTTEQTILQFHATAVGPGKFLEAKVVYIRITNLDDAYHVTLIFKNENDDECAVKLDKGQSFIFNGDLAGGVVDTVDAVDNATLTPSLGDLVEIRADADTASVDLEVFVASI